MFTAVCPCVKSTSEVKSSRIYYSTCLEFKLPHHRYLYKTHFVSKKWNKCIHVPEFHSHFDVQYSVGRVPCVLVFGGHFHAANAHCRQHTNSLGFDSLFRQRNISPIKDGAIYT